MAKKNEPDQLAQDAAAALAAGMSYGRWKAAQPVVEVKKNLPAIGIPTRRCALCGVEFRDDENKNKKYCTVNCRNKAVYIRRKERENK